MLHVWPNCGEFSILRVTCVPYPALSTDQNIDVKWPVITLDKESASPDVVYHFLLPSGKQT